MPNCHGNPYPTILEQKQAGVHHWHPHFVHTNCRHPETGRVELNGSAQSFIPAREWKALKAKEKAERPTLAQLIAKAETGS